MAGFGPPAQAAASWSANGLPGLKNGWPGVGGGLVGGLGRSDIAGPLFRSGPVAELPARGGTAGRQVPGSSVKDIRGSAARHSRSLRRSSMPLSR